MNKCNAGIIGYGWASGAHIAAINATSLAQVTAIYSSRPQDAAALSAKHGGPITTYMDLDAMLADADLQIVSICGYPHQHADHIVAAAKAGKMLDSGDVFDHPYQAQFQAFFESLERGQPMSLTSLHEAMKSHYAVLAADLSAAERRTVKLSELDA